MKTVAFTVSIDLLNLANELKSTVSTGRRRFQQFMTLSLKWRPHWTTGKMFIKFKQCCDCSLPHFSAHVYCGQTAGWIRIPLGTEVSPVPGDIVLDGDPASPHGKRHSSPSTFRSMSIVAKRSPISASAELLFHPVSANFDLWRWPSNLT